MKPLQKTFYKSKSYLTRHSPTILSCVSVIGVVSTTVMAVKATPRAMKICEGLRRDRVNDYKDEPSKLEYVKAAFPCYIPTVIIGLSTISCIFGANILNKKQQQSIVSAYTMLDQSYKRYRKAANSVYGEDADSKIKIQVAKEMYVSADGYSIYDSELDKTGEKTLFYDDYSQRYFTSTISSVLNAQYHVNRNFNLRGDTTLNEFYEFLGIDKIDSGDYIGWSMDYLIESGIIWIDFENHNTRMEDGMECCIISSLYEPTVLYEG